MPVQIDGTYEDGKVTLASVPAGVRRARVVATFIAEPAQSVDPPPVPAAALAEGGGPQKKTFASLRGVFRGQFAADEEDFKAAEWHPTKEDLDV